MLFLLFIDNIISPARKLQSLRMLVNKAFYMPNTLLFENLINGNEYSCLLYITKAIVDSSAKSFMVGERFI